jgi:hypothetical protein
MSITITSGEAKQKRLVTMRKGVVAAALSIDNKFREQYGEPVFRSQERGVLLGMRNPYARTSPYRVAMITLTYAPDVEWSALHIAALLKNYREWFKRRGHRFHFVWTVEMQGNGRPHYHVIAWFPRGLTPPFADEQGWWKHGLSNAMFAFSPVGYIAKYVSKTVTQSGHHLPKGARLWGHGGLLLDERAGIAYATAPRWLKALVSPQAFPKRQQVTTTVYRTLKGEFLNFKRTVSAWVATAGDGKGWAYFSPYRLEDVGQNGLVLSHTGVIECVCPQGQSFFLSHRS